MNVCEREGKEKENVCVCEREGGGEAGQREKREKEEWREIRIQRETKKKMRESDHSIPSKHVREKTV